MLFPIWPVLGMPLWQRDTNEVCLAQEQDFTVEWLWVMKVIEIQPGEDLSKASEADVVWFDWDLYRKSGYERKLRKLLLDLPSSKLGTCVLTEQLESIPEDLLNDPKFQGVLFVEKSQARVNGKFDASNLFEGISADPISPIEDHPGREDWEVDFQGYLVKKNRSSNTSSSNNPDLDEDPYARALRFLDPSLSKH
jgi:hypothetical protein